jgi:ankyrin repeat protein
VSFLLEARASLNIQDSFKNTPLNDAVRHKHDDVALALRNSGARPITLPGYEMGVQMCTFAAEGNLDQLQRMLLNGVDVNLSVSPTDVSILIDMF